MIYKVVKSRCSCHPETCSHYEYQIITESGALIAVGDWPEAMTMLVDAANSKQLAENNKAHTGRGE